MNAEAPRERIGRVLREYADGTEDELPLGGYGALVGAFGVLFGGMLVALSRKKVLARSYSASDIVLFGLATHKLTRLATRDWVTAPLRAPFARYEGSDNSGEVKESSRGHGLRRALGDLATCQFCAGPWFASALLGASRVRPRETRFVATVFAIVSVSDFIHHVYAGAKKLSK